MKKRLAIPTLLAILWIGGCQENEDDLIFRGSGENWSAKVIAQVIDGTEKNEIELKYKGYDIESIETIDYNVKNNNNEIDFGANKVTLNKDGVYKNVGLSSNSHSTSIDDELVVTVDWNGNNERFILKTNE